MRKGKDTKKSSPTMDESLRFEDGRAHITLSAPLECEHCGREGRLVEELTDPERGKWYYIHDYEIVGNAVDKPIGYSGAPLGIRIKDGCRVYDLALQRANWIELGGNDSEAKGGWTGTVSLFDKRAFEVRPNARGENVTVPGVVRYEASTYAWPPYVND